MRIFIASLFTETNTFAPWPTGMQAFTEAGLFRGNASEGSGPANLVARRWRQLADADGHVLVEGLFAAAQPSGPVVQSVYERLRDEILASMTGEFDVVLLYLHGAMVAGDCDDCEGDLVDAIRARTGGKTRIGAVLDPHCHISARFLQTTDVVILMKEYPHIDYVERAQELYVLCTAAANGRITPIVAHFDCRMIGFYPTTPEPMAGLLREMRRIEQRPGVLSASLIHGFPWGDTPETGSGVLVYADGDAELAARTATELGRLFYDRREALLPRMPDIETALDQAIATSGCVVIADTADNAGGGAPADNVSLLRAMLARRLKSSVFGCVWDPVAASICADAGIGARFPLRLGGKCGPSSGDPLDVIVQVRGVRESHDQAGLGNSRVALGLSVWLECDGIDVVVVSRRNQTFAPDAFSGLGIGLEGKRLLAVKSSQHFRTHFESMASLILPTATPGAIQMDFASIDYRKRDDFDFFPRVPDPLAAGADRETAAPGGGVLCASLEAEYSKASLAEHTESTRHGPGAAAM